MMCWITDNQGVVRGSGQDRMEKGVTKPHISRYGIWYVQADRTLPARLPDAYRAADAFCKEMNK